VSEDTLTIEPKKAGGKGRTLRVQLLGMLTADRFWEGSSRTAYRPIYLAYAGTYQTVRAFTANLRTGRPATLRNRHGSEQAKQVEVARAAVLKFPKPQRLANGVAIQQAYMPALCDVEPGKMPERISFLFAPPEWWVAAQLGGDQRILALPEPLRRDAALGAYFCAHADARSPYPMIPDALFRRRLYLAAKTQPWWLSPQGNPYSPGPLWAYPDRIPGLAAVGYVCAEHEEWEDLLRRETAAYFREERNPEWLTATAKEIAEEERETAEAHAPATEARAIMQTPGVGPAGEGPQEAASAREEEPAAMSSLPCAPPPSPAQISIFDLL